MVKPLQQPLHSLQAKIDARRMQARQARDQIAEWAGLG
jgi:hypothetical protein